MAIMIREYLGNEGIQVEWNKSITESVELKEYAERVYPILENSLMVDIEGIHVGPTRNYTWYTEQALQGSIPTWTKPYQRPLIMHHNEKDGKIIGRIKYVAYTDKNTRSNTGALMFTANVPDEEGKNGINNGTLETTSIGVIAHDVKCSICGHNIAEEGPCEHERGNVYDGKVCYWMIYSMEAKELSYVIVPSDIYAHNIRVYKPQKSDLKESSKGVLDLSEATKIDPIKEGQTIDENGEKNPETPVDKTKEITALEAEVEKLKNEKKELEGKVETLTSEKAIALKDLESAQTTLSDVQKTLTAKETEIATANSLREAAETETINMKKDLKESLVDKVSLLRQALGKPVMTTEDLNTRSEESLKDSIKDLKEELGNPKDVTKITQTKNPGLVENDEGIKDPSVKEGKNASNINLAEGLEAIFTSLLGSSNNKF